MSHELAISFGRFVRLPNILAVSQMPQTNQQLLNELADKETPIPLVTRSEQVSCPINNRPFHYWGLPNMIGIRSPSFGDKATRKFNKPCDHYISSWNETLSSQPLKETLEQASETSERIYCVTDAELSPTEFQHRLESSSTAPKLYPFGTDNREPHQSELTDYR